MFNEKYTNAVGENKENAISVSVAFIKSSSIQAFPCGRRRSTPYTENDDSRIPFDPEARLNTEANNRKHSSLNGFTQTYLERWDSKQLVLSLGGYLFNITLDENTAAKADFVNAFAFKDDNIKNSINSIYANIQVDNTKLFTNTYDTKSLTYYTDVLGSWTSADRQDESALDLPTQLALGENTTELDKYYFSGLAFSSVPVATIYKYKQEDDTISLTQIPTPTRDEYSTGNEKIISLRILDKVNGEWKIHNPARLPKIEHGNNDNSTVIAELESDKITADIITANTIEVPHKAGNTTIGNLDDNLDGIDTPYLHAETLQADGITVGDTVKIKDSDENVVTTVGDNISTKNNITADQNLYQKLGSSDSTWKVPVIQLVNNQLQISNIGKKSQS